MARRARPTRLPAPFLRRIAWRTPEAARPDEYPFTLPFLKDQEWSLDFTTPITITMGENGVGKSTLIEGIASLAGYNQAGGAKGYATASHGDARESSGGGLADHWRASWLPKVTEGWFFRAETFWTVARWLDSTGSQSDFLSHSHGEGFLRVFAERCTRPGLYLLDEPESALSPGRQLDLLALLAELHERAQAQVILATHSPILMALPGARLLQMTRFGLDEVSFQDTRHFRLYRAFTTDPEAFIAEELSERRRAAEY